MTVFNAMPYLPDAISSVVEQTYSDFQLIVIDDGSTDGSSEFLRSVTDQRMTLVHQSNQGQHCAANRGINMAATELIARMDADDVAQPDRLMKQVAYLDANPQVGLVGGQILRLGAKRAGLPSNLPTRHQDIVSALMRNRHGMCNATTMFRAELFHRVGGYWEHNLSEDWDLFLRMAEVSELANLDDLLLSVRFHSRSLNGRRIVEAQLYNEYAAKLASLRAQGSDEMTFSEFMTGHRSRRWPESWLFHLDCHSINQYRIAVANLYNGQTIRGSARLVLSMLMSPHRTLLRTVNMVSRRPAIDVDL